MLKICLINILLIISLQAYSQTEDIRFRQVSGENELSNNSVLSVCQDFRGFMWFGTRNGINRYDGTEFVVYNHDLNDSTSLISNQVNNIIEDSNNILWLATAGGVCIYNREENDFRRVYDIKNQNIPINNYLTSIVEDNYHNIWIGGPNVLMKLTLMDKNTGYCKIESFNKQFPFSITALYKDFKAILWIGTKAGLFKYDPKNLSGNHFQKIQKVGDVQVNSVLRIRNGNLLIATEEDGVISLDINNSRLRTINYKPERNSTLISNKVRALYEDIDGNIWIGTRFGLSIYNPDKNSFSNYTNDLTNPFSLNHNSIKCIYEDVSGGIWLSTYSGGVNYYNKQFMRFEHFREKYEPEQSISYNIVSYLFKDSGGILWIGTEGNGLDRYDEETGEFTHFTNFKDHLESLDNIKSISESDNETLWLGTNGGLVSFNKRSYNFTNYINDPEDPGSLSYNQVHATLVDNNGNLWVGTNSGGLDLLQPDSDGFIHFRQSDSFGSLISNNINYLLEGSNGNIWIGTEGGLDCIDPVEMKFLRNNSETNQYAEMPVFRIITLFEDSDKLLWIGTEGQGLVSYNQSDLSYKQYTVIDGLSNNTINAIEEDNDKNLWISTNAGLSRISFKSSTEGKKIQLIKNYSSEDGLQGNTFSYRSSEKAEDGKIYFGGAHGFNAFYPYYLNDSIVTPEVQFTRLRINYQEMGVKDYDSPLSKDINLEQKIFFRYYQQQFSLDFIGINYINPGNIYYSYMLEGKDENWIKIGKQKSLTFTYLEPGEYDLRIKASGDPNIWGKNYSSIEIKIIPPPWKSWWAYTLYIIFILALIIFFIVYSIRWFKLRTNLEFERLSKAREEKMHEMKVRFFTDVSHELRTPLTLILSPLEKLISEVGNNLRISKQLLLIERNGKRMLNLVNQLMNLRKFETGHMKLHAAKGNISRFVQETTLPFRELARTREIDLVFTTSPEDIVAWFDRDKLEIVLNNLLSNALKVTSSHGKIEVQVSKTKLRVKPTEKESINQTAAVSENFIEIIVRDYGKGIPAELLPEIFNRFYSSGSWKLGTGVGLELTKRMVELHYGRISVKSEEAKKKKSGKTTFKVLLPMGKEHISEDQIIDNYKTSEEISLYKEKLLETEIIDENTNTESSNLEKVLDATKEKPLMVIVEDNIDLCLFIANLFSDSFSIKTAFNGVEGWEIILNSIPDIIISDVMMPKMDGIELCRFAKTDKRTCHIPIILLTARTHETYKFDGLETGADDYIHKPFSTNYLVIKVKNLILQRKQVQDHFYRNSYIRPEELAVSSIDEKLLKKALLIIDKRMSDPELSVDSLSKELGLSRVHFYRKIKTLTDLTAVEFIRAIRLKKAAELLEYGNMNISEVQYHVGFLDAEYFRKSFKKQFKVTPREYFDSHLSI